MQQLFLRNFIGMKLKRGVRNASLRKNNLWVSEHILREFTMGEYRNNSRMFE